MEKDEKKGLETMLTEAVEQFCRNDLAYSDSALIAIALDGTSAAIVDVDPEEDPDSIIESDPSHDYILVMDLVESDPANPGQWSPDREAIADLASQY